MNGSGKLDERSIGAREEHLPHVTRHSTSYGDPGKAASNLYSQNRLRLTSKIRYASQDGLVATENCHGSFETACGFPSWPKELQDQENEVTFAHTTSSHKLPEPPDQ